MLLAQIHIKKYLLLLIIKAWIILAFHICSTETDWIFTVSAEQFCDQPSSVTCIPQILFQIAMWMYQEKNHKPLKICNCVLASHIGQTIHTMQCYTFLQTINCRLPNPNIITKTTLIIQKVRNTLTWTIVIIRSLKLPLNQTTWVFWSCTV